MYMSLPASCLTPLPAKCTPVSGDWPSTLWALLGQRLKGKPLLESTVMIFSGLAVVDLLCCVMYDVAMLMCHVGASCQCDVAMSM